MNKEETDKAIKEMREAKCAYPFCEKKNMMTCSLPVVRKTEDGKIVAVDENEEGGMQITVTLCEDHMPYAMMGLFACLLDGDKTYLHGDFKTIETARAVYMAERMKEEPKEEKEDT